MRKPIKKSEKVRYELDPYNRLIARGGSLRGARRVIDGQFRVSAHNAVWYHVKAPLPAGAKAPRQMKLKGDWSLADGHNLRLTLDKTSRQTFGDQLTLQGEILDVRKNALLFAVTTRTKDNTPSVYILELAGAWQADERNRLTFRAQREHGRTDILTFQGAWEIDDAYRLTYTYQKKQLLRKAARTHTLVFRGQWDIRGKARVSYVLEKETGSGFDLKTGIGVFKDRSIKYEVGIGLSRGRRPLKRVIAFFGAWKLHKKAGLVFEVRQSERRVQAFVFGAEARLTDKGALSCKLKDERDKGMGVELELSRDIFKGNGQAYLRLLTSRQETAILAGSGWQW